MASLSVEGTSLTLRFKAWDKDLLLEFDIPSYVLDRTIQKWSLPTVELRKGKIVYTFCIKEAITPRKTGSVIAGIDLGRVEPFTMTVVNRSGQRVADYTAKSHVKAINARRERILREKKCITAKASHYEKLGLDSTTLCREAALKTNKVSRLGHQLALQVGADVAKKLARHNLNQVALENLTWVAGPRYGGRWIHSKKSAAIEHAVARHGITVQKVNARGTSSTCHQCGNIVIINSKTRTVRCATCQTKLDRDFNAAMNIAKELPTYPTQHGRRGDNCSTKVQVIEETPHRSGLRIVDNTT